MNFNQGSQSSYVSTCAIFATNTPKPISVNELMRTIDVHLYLNFTSLRFHASVVHIFYHFLISGLW